MKNQFTITEVRKHWDAVAKIYEPTNSNVGYVHTQRFERAMQFAKVQPGEKVLNIWSRTGNLVPYIRTVPRVKLTNLEASKSMLAIAKKKYPKETFEQTDLESLNDIKDNYFDKIISLETLEHVPDPSTFLRELFRVLKPKATLVMSLPPRGFEIPTRLYDRFFHNHGEGPHQFLWSWEVKQLLKDSGFKLKIHQGYMILPMKSDAMTRNSESILTKLFTHTPIIEFGVRHFYVCTK